jgi:hypothetical protein
MLDTFFFVTDDEDKPSWRVCSWQAFPALSYICDQDHSLPEPGKACQKQTLWLILTHYSVVKKTVL